MRSSILFWRILLTFNETGKSSSVRQQTKADLFQKQKNRNLQFSRQTLRRILIKKRVNVPGKMPSIKNGIAINWRKWEQRREMKQSKGSTSFSAVPVKDIVLTNANWKQAAEKIVVLESITDCFIRMKRMKQTVNWPTPVITLLWQRMLAVESCKWCLSRYQKGQTWLKVEMLSVRDTGSTLYFFDSGINSLLGIDRTKLILTVTGINGTKNMIIEKVSAKVFATIRDENETFHVDPGMYLRNCRYDYSQFKQKYKHIQVWPNEIVNIHDLKNVLGQDNFHLFFPAVYKKSRRNKRWAAITKLGWTLSGPLPEHETAQIGTTFSANDHDWLADKLKTWWSSSKTYASRCKVSGQSREAKRAIEFLEKTAKLSEGRYDVDLIWLDDEKIPKNCFSAYCQLCSLDRRLQNESNLCQSRTSTNVNR